MIITNKGEVTLEGSTSKICAELVCTIKSVYEAITEKEGEKNARKLVTMCFEDAFKSEEEIKKETEEMLLQAVFGGM